MVQHKYSLSGSNRSILLKKVLQQECCRTYCYCIYAMYRTITSLRAVDQQQREPYQPR